MKDVAIDKQQTVSIDYERLVVSLSGRGVDIEAVKSALKAQRIETPSWGYGDSGTRFKVFSWPGAARDVYEKLADAAFIHRLTGIAPSVALHIPWDKPALSPSTLRRGSGQALLRAGSAQDKLCRRGGRLDCPQAVRRRTSRTISTTAINAITCSAAFESFSHPPR